MKFLEITENLSPNNIGLRLTIQVTQQKAWDIPSFFVIVLIQLAMLKNNVDFMT